MQLRRLSATTTWIITMRVIWIRITTTMDGVGSHHLLILVGWSRLLHKYARSDPCYVITSSQVPKYITESPCSLIVHLFAMQLLFYGLFEDIGYSFHLSLSMCPILPVPSMYVLYNPPFTIHKTNNSMINICLKYRLYRPWISWSHH